MLLPIHRWNEAIHVSYSKLLTTQPEPGRDLGGLFSASWKKELRYARLPTMMQKSYGYY